MAIEGVDYFKKYYEYLFQLQAKLGNQLDKLLDSPKGMPENKLMWKYLEIHQKLSVYFQWYDWEKKCKEMVYQNTYERVYTTEKNLYFYHRIEGKVLKLSINDTLKEVTIAFLTGPQEQSIAYVYGYMEGKWQLTWANVPVIFH